MWIEDWLDLKSRSVKTLSAERYGFLLRGHVVPHLVDPPRRTGDQSDGRVSRERRGVRGKVSGPEHVVRTRTFLLDVEDSDDVGRAHGEMFGDVRPASTMIVVAGLLDPRWLVEIEADALLPA